MSALLAPAVDFVLTGGGLLQDYYQNDREIALEQEQHEEILKQMKEQFDQELEQEKKSYLVAAYNDMERYFQEINENLINSTLDAERDMIDQRNQQYQTILIASTMMFTALISILYQGGLPSNSQPYLKICYALFNSLSLVLLLLAIALCALIVKNVTSFMLKRSKDGKRHLSQAIKHTKKIRDDVKMMGLASSIDRQHCREAAESKESLHATDHPQQQQQQSPAGKMSPTRTSGGSGNAHHLVDLKEEDIEQVWRGHEAFIQELLSKRAEIVAHKEQYLIVDRAFELYWASHCKGLAEVSLIVFYLGTAFMLVVTFIFTGAQFAFEYHSMTASLASVIILGSSILMGLGVVFYLRKFDPYLIRFDESLQEEAHQDRADIRHSIIQLLTPQSTRSSVDDLESGMGSGDREGQGQGLWRWSLIRSASSWMKGRGNKKHKNR
eukprot:gene4844-5311_t